MRLSLAASGQCDKSAARSQPDGLSNLVPSSVFLSLQATQVRGRHRERAVVEEPTDVLDALAGITPQLGGRVAENMHTGGREGCALQVAPQVSVERAVEQAFARGRWPERVVLRHHIQRLSPGGESSLDRIESWRG